MSSPKSRMKKWKVSRYTHRIELNGGGGALYNGYSGAIVELSAGAYKKVCTILDQLNIRMLDEIERQPLFPHLIAGGFVVADEVDELEIIEQQYESERKRSKFLLTILPTFDCNLRCTYCFMGKKSGAMKLDICEQIARFATNHLATHSVSSMSVDWLGGEPLLAIDIISSLSSEFRELCDMYGIPYYAQVITNGTLLTETVVQSLQEAGVERLQITVDGPPDVHDKRRGFKSGHGSSFAAIMKGIGFAIGKFIIRLRINIDSHNMTQVWRLLDLFDQRGWLKPETGFFPYLARLSPYTETCAHVASFVCNMDDFYTLQFKWWEHLERLGLSVAFQPLYQFPEPRLYNCSAVGANGFIFTPDGEVHKCGLTVDDSTQSIGRVDQPLDINHPNNRQWLEYSPFKIPVCRECSFLPTCLGGCPRNQLQQRKGQIKENCRYYRLFESQILRFHLELFKRRSVSH